MPDPTPLLSPSVVVDRAIDDYRSMLRRNDGNAQGLPLTAEINLQATRNDLKAGETPQLAARAERDKIVAHIAAQRERSSHPNHFSDADKANLGRVVEANRASAAIAREVSRDLSGVLQSVQPASPHSDQAARMLSAADRADHAASTASSVRQAEQFVGGLGNAGAARPAATSGEDFSGVLKQPFKPNSERGTTAAVTESRALPPSLAAQAHTPLKPAPHVQGNSPGGKVGGVIGLAVTAMIAVGATLGTGGTAKAAVQAAGEAVIPGATADREGRPMEAHYSRIEATGLGLLGTQPIRLANDIAREKGSAFADLDPSIPTQAYRGIKAMVSEAIENTQANPPATVNPGIAAMGQKIRNHHASNIQTTTLASLASSAPANAMPKAPAAAPPQLAKNTL